MQSTSRSFKFKVEENIAGVDLSASSTQVSFQLTPSAEQAALQERYRTRHLEMHQETLQAVETPLQDKKRKVETVPPRAREPQEELRRKVSSERLRASKTFTAFREYVNEYMMWVTIDENDPDDVAAYANFIANPAPTDTHEMSDDNLEFLFRHVNPRPESIDDDYKPILQVLALTMPGSSTRSSKPLDADKLEERRWQTRERMARRRAAIKAMPPAVQSEHNERARAARTKYRAQHRMQLILKERCRRENKSRANQSLDEFIRRRRVRESKAAQAAAKRIPHSILSQAEASEPDELVE
ncbi:hypothetical protein C8R43DRAFT_946599 [Mycena crocata]|nr:hypothetical protein C8R43DRAFT_946599 [Mycena crocata]